MVKKTTKKATAKKAAAKKTAVKKPVSKKIKSKFLYCKDYDRQTYLKKILSGQKKFKKIGRVKRSIFYP